MLEVDCKNLSFFDLNKKIRETDDDVQIYGLLGERFIGAGLSDKKLFIHGTPGNALGAYLNGATIEVFGNAQDAVGDTMNDGKIIVHGNIGDATCYAMRGGKMFVRGNAGYRAGIHMKEYKEKVPVLVIGGSVGSFLGEYQAGGIIIVLGLESDKIVGNFPCTGMHGGKMFLRSDCRNVVFPDQVTARTATPEDLDEIRESIGEFCDHFKYDAKEVLSGPFTVIEPDSSNPYRQLYVQN